MIVVEHDGGGNYSSTTNAYTCPSNGFYHFDYEAGIKGVTSFTGFKSVILKIAGPTLSWAPPTAIQYTSIQHTIHYSFDGRFAAGDVVKVTVTQSTGGTQSVSYGLFSGYRVY